MDRYFSLVCVQKITFRIIKKREQEQKKQEKKRKEKRRGNEESTYTVWHNRVSRKKDIHIEDGAGLHDHDTKSFRNFTYVLIIRYVETWKVSTI